MSITAKAESSGGDPVLLSIPAYLTTIATDPNEDTRYVHISFHLNCITNDLILFKI